MVLIGDENYDISHRLAWAPIMPERFYAVVCSMSSVCLLASCILSDPVIWSMSLRNGTTDNATVSLSCSPVYTPITVISSKPSYTDLDQHPLHHKLTTISRYVSASFVSQCVVLSSLLVASFPTLKWTVETVSRQHFCMRRPFPFTLMAIPAVVSAMALAAAIYETFKIPSVLDGVLMSAHPGLNCRSVVVSEGQSPIEHSVCKTFFEKHEPVGTGEITHGPHGAWARLCFAIVACLCSAWLLVASHRHVWADAFAVERYRQGQHQNRLSSHMYSRAPV
ncbi:unnamed protein product (mitochondrion) [Plasmodiophora brassicae]|uniref:Uncharacterized protein n=1 Tax=Plasmodiophora brassicae TaxID=37360 RepID=A0A0G4ILD8_PLABS|nr:hypothetical protein PBRA_004610 [Plasmodiophora brassicae]SPQ93533.1 unnamed protein product [Plasmodiophora brassicae]